jgi:hypothetical protein
MFRQKKHKANSSSALFNLWSGIFIERPPSQKGLPLQFYHATLGQLLGERSNQDYYVVLRARVWLAQASLE